ncbi:MAG: hypothetical protein RIR70_1719 [Pseudomonadota bacterium]|jgi:glycerol-3-phosphate dehydrogenase (NAD(P)+)
MSQSGQRKLAVIGAGAWGTALAVSFAASHRVSLYSREHDVADEMRAKRESARYLPGVRLPDSLVIETDFARTVRDADLALVATPLAGLRGSVRALKEHAKATPLLWACKGLEARTSLLPHQIAEQELAPGVPCAALTGPSFAAEVARGLPAAVTIASSNIAFAQQLCRDLHQPRLRLYANDDVIGAEVGGAVKNVMAIAAGIADGMGFGLNARAALLTRGLAEMARLGLALGGKRDTFLGLAGMGDLILTCTGDLSRNRSVGLGLSQGKPLEDILRDLGHVAEGVSTTREAARLASRYGVDMPITQAMDGILFHGLSAQDAVNVLLTREPTVE